MTNKQFEEWLDTEFMIVNLKETSTTLSGNTFVKIAHAIRNKVLHEAIEALPEEIDMQRAIDANSDTGAGHVIGHNHLLREIKSSLLNLLTKE